jgi:AcrR family transcriptional regulator
MQDSFERTPRERRQLRTHQAILDAARQIVHEEGLNALSIRAIAERIDYSPAGLYEYFGSKEEIIEAISLQGFAKLTEYLLRAMAGIESPVEQLQAIGLAYIHFAEQNPDYFLLMFTTDTGKRAHTSAVPMPEINLAQVSAIMVEQGSAFGVLVDVIQRGIDSGLFHVRPAMGLPEMTYAAWSLVHGIAMLRVTQLKVITTDMEAVDRAVLALLGSGLQQ